MSDGFKVALALVIGFAGAAICVAGMVIHENNAWESWCTVMAALGLLTGGVAAVAALWCSVILAHRCQPANPRQLIWTLWL